jgi:hypothetical protein
MSESYSGFGIFITAGRELLVGMNGRGFLIRISCRVCELLVVTEPPLAHWKAKEKRMMVIIEKSRLRINEDLLV